MKKGVIIVLLVMFIVLLAGCSNENIDVTSNEVISTPIKKNTSVSTTTSKTIEKTTTSKVISGTKEHPIQLAGIESMKTALVGNTKGKYYKITKDIINQTEYNLNSFDNFEGYLDGGNHIISNIMVNGDGLFKGITGEVKNLKLEKIHVSGSSTGFDLKCGVLAGRLYSKAKVANCSIIDCKISASAKTYNDVEGLNIRCYAGGIVGYMDYESSITNSKVKNLNVHCNSQYHDRGWQADPESEAPRTYFGGITACMMDESIIKNNVVEDIKCNAFNHVRVNCWFWGPDIYSIMSLAGIVGYVNNATSVKLENNETNVNETNFNYYLTAINEGVLNLLGKQKNWCYVGKEKGAIYGSLKIGINSTTGKKTYV